MKKLKLFLVLILIGCAGNAQVIVKGRVVSSLSNKKPIEEVYVFEKGTVNGDIADSLGFFKLQFKDIKKDYEIEVSVGAYPTTKFRIKHSNQPKVHTLLIKGECDIDGKKAISDLKDGLAKFYLIGGIAPVANTKEDTKFEKKYNVTYYDFGCEPQILECIIEYNNIVSTYLDQRHGQKWRKQARHDIVLRPYRGKTFE